MPGVVILIALATICSAIDSGAPSPVADPVAEGKIRLAQATTTPAVPRPTVGPSTPVTSTVTNCMMSCNAQAANCYTGCFIPPPPATAAASSGRGGASPFGSVTLNATTNSACSSGCSSTQLACHTNCALLSPSR